MQTLSLKPARPGSVPHWYIQIPWDPIPVIWQPGSPCPVCAAEPFSSMPEGRASQRKWITVGSAFLWSCEWLFGSRGAPGINTDLRHMMVRWVLSPPCLPGIPAAPGSAAPHLIAPLTIPAQSHACPIVQRLPWGHGSGTPLSPSAWDSSDPAVQRVPQESPRCMDSSACVGDPHSRWDPPRHDSHGAH